MGDSILSQAEIDALLKVTAKSKTNRQPVLAAKVTFAVRSEYPTTGCARTFAGAGNINERFARHFRMGLFNLLRRSRTLPSGPSAFSRTMNLPATSGADQPEPYPSETAARHRAGVFSPSLVFIAVDNLFGGDGRSRPKWKVASLPIPNSASSTDVKAGA